MTVSAATPKATGDADLPPMASRFVDVAALDWEKAVYEGVWIKTPPPIGPPGC